MAEPLTLNLSDDVIAKINDHVRSGRFASASDFVDTAIENWEATHEGVPISDADHEERSRAIKANIQHTLDEPRPSVPVEEARKRFHRNMDEPDRTI